MKAAQFLSDFIEALPYRIHTVFTDNGIQLMSGQRDIYDGNARVRAHLHLFLDAYHHTRRLKTLRGLTPTEFTPNA